MRFLTVSLLSCCVLIAACSGQQLSRPKAAAIIKKELFTPSRFNPNVMNYQEGANQVQNEGYVKNQLRALEKSGWITLSVHGCSLNSCSIDSGLTDKGKAHSSDWKPFPGAGPGYWTFSTAQDEFLEVTGIATVEKGVAVVEYTYHSVPTDTGKALGMEPSSPQKGSVQFQLYDDGWRISQ